MKPLEVLFFSLEAQTQIPEDTGTLSRACPCLCGALLCPVLSVWESVLKFPVVSKVFSKERKLLRVRCSVLTQPGDTGAWSERWINQLESQCSDTENGVGQIFPKNRMSGVPLFTALIK